MAWQNFKFYAKTKKIKIKTKTKNNIKKLH
jgi:hypothetical protein